MNNKSYRNTNYSINNTFFDWSGQNLPAANTFFISDIDTAIYTFSSIPNKLMLVEIKCKQRQVKPHQKRTFTILHKLIKAGLKANDNFVKINDIDIKLFYYGFHLLQFENTAPGNGLIYWNYNQITEKELIDRLSLNYETSLAESF